MSELGKLADGCLDQSLVVKDSVSPAKRPEAVRSAVLKIASAEGKLDILAGELLYEIRESGYYSSYGYASFEEYLNDEVPFKRRKAFYLMRIYEKFVKELGIPTEKLLGVDWSKAKELVSVITKENWENLLKEIKTMTVQEVIDMVASMRGKKRTPKTIVGSTVETFPETAAEADGFFKTSFALTKEQLDNVEAALKLAGIECESTKRGHLLDIICTDYIAGRADSKEAMEALCMRLQKQIENIERGYGVHLVIEEKK